MLLFSRRFIANPMPRPLSASRVNRRRREACGALARLLESYFGEAGPWREAGCKAWRPVSLHALSRAVGKAEVDGRDPSTTRDRGSIAAGVGPCPGELCRAFVAGKGGGLVRHERR